MEETVIWIVTVVIILLIVLPYVLKFRRTQKEGRHKQQESIRLGADKAVAQHPQIDQYTCIGCGACVAACPEGEVLGIISGKAVIINGLKCVGHGKCAEACPVQGITIGLGDMSQRDDIPSLSKINETNIPGLFIAGELGGLALIRNAINQGSMVVDHVAARNPGLKNDSVPDVLIIGAGPAGMSAGLAAINNNLSYILIDQQEAGGTILQYPRKKLVMTKPVEIPLYGKLMKSEYTKEELLEIWHNLKSKYNLNLKTSEKLLDVQKQNDIFLVKTTKNSYQAKNVVLALGRRGTPRKLNVTGENQSKVMYKLIDAESYQGEHVLVVGGGDSAVEAAMGLARQKNNHVTLSYRKDQFFRIKTRNQERLKELIRQDKINVILNSSVLSIESEHVILNTSEGEKKLANNYIFVFAGGEPPFTLLKKIGIQFGAAH